MKILLILPILLFFNNNLYSKVHKPKFQKSNTQSVLIEGRIWDYKQKDDNAYITFRTNDYNGILKDTSFYINPDGSFSGIINQPFESDIVLMYRGGYIDLYYFPGEKLIIEINETKWSNSDAKINALIIKGNSFAIVKLIAQFKGAMKGHVFKTDTPWQDSTSSDEAAAAGRIHRLQEELLFLNDYLKSNNITNKKFKSWVVNELNYQAAEDVATTSFKLPRKRSLTTKQLMKVLKDIPIENISALHNSAYYSFLFWLQGAFQIIINTNSAYKDLIRSNGYNPLPLYLDQIDHYSCGMAKQLMYYDCYSMNKGYAALHYSRFDSVITAKGLRNAFIARKNKEIAKFVPFNIVERLELSKTDSATKFRLIDLFKSRAGRYIFLDFWGSWCSPCMREMPIYPEFIKKLESNNLIFLFLAVGTQEKTSLDTKQKYGIEADFIVLNDNETILLNNVLRFNSYPNHFLLTPKLFVIDNSFSILLGTDKLNPKAVEKVSNQIFKK